MTFDPARLVSFILDLLTRRVRVTIDARFKDAALRVVVTNPGIRGATISDIRLGYGTNPASMLVFAHLSEPATGIHLEADKSHFVPPIPTATVKGVANGKGTHQVPNGRLLVCVDLAGHGTRSAPVLFDPALIATVIGDKLDWGKAHVIGSDMALGFRTVPNGYEL